MSLELTTADKSTRAGILSALNQQFIGLPSLDGTQGYYTSKVEVVWTDEAVEGISVPDGSSDTFVKTYPLSRSYSNGAYIVVPPINSELGVAGLNSPKLVQALTTVQDQVSADGSWRNGTTNFIQYIGSIMGLGNFSSNSTLMYVTQDYTQARKLSIYPGFSFFGPFDSNGQDIFTQVGPGFGKTYTELNNTLYGYYNGPFSKASYFTALPDGEGDFTAFVLESAYIDGNNLKFCFKKAQSSTSANIVRAAIVIIDGNI
jgi:hypothetical protein